MKRYALIFLAAIFLPSLVLGWLALRTAAEQRVLIERQATNLHQTETDVIATEVRALLEEKQREFEGIVRGMASEQGLSDLAVNYGPLLTREWVDGGTPFAINPQGALAYPTPAEVQTDQLKAEFLANNSAFLSNRAVVEIYTNQANMAKSKSQNQSQLNQFKNFDPAQNATIEPDEQALSDKDSQISRRNISPQKAPAPSRVAPAVSNFQTAVGEQAQGVLSRFAQNDLQVFFWTRPDPGSNWLFGIMLSPQELNELVQNSLPQNTGEDIQLAILNEKTRPVTKSPPSFTADWKRPFVATEIGEMLPHWEVALYLTDPNKLTDSAHLITVTLIFLIVLALAAILAGGYFVAIDTRRQLALAQKKTDFVSNVSHELKTPLTSIRMFSELLAEDRVKEPEKRNRYLRIISSESERLARLVNNVLDFARLEKNKKTYDKRLCDLSPVISAIWETESVRLSEAGFSVNRETEPGPYPVLCDADAISQVLVNLISNAEKYCGTQRDILLRTQTANGALEIAILDRGHGVPRGLEEKIFEAFYRADDSLASGIQGSGLGLTLARNIARDHDGDLTCQPRPDGGSIFTLTLPLHSTTT